VTVHAPLPAPASADGESNPADPESRPISQYQEPRQQPPAPRQPDNLLFGVAGKLALVLLVIFACAAGWKMIQMAVPHNPLPSGASLHVQSTVAIAPQRFLHVVRIGQRQLLLSSSPQQIALLGTLDAESGFATVQEAALPALGPGTAAAGSEPPDRFEEMFHRLTERETESPEPAPAGSLFATRAWPEREPARRLDAAEGARVRPPLVTPPPVGSYPRDERVAQDREVARPPRPSSSTPPYPPSRRSSLFRIAADTAVGTPDA
jgi:flagellar biogenesis protein FliO